MTLSEALKSGKRFRWKQYGTFGPGEWNGRGSEASSYVFPTAVLMRDEWEVKPDPEPKLKAWIDDNGRVYFLRDWIIEDAGKVTRAPWLDEP